MIRTFTREDYETLKPYEEHLVRAKYGRYVYGLRRPIFDVLVGVYKSLGYSQRLDYSCNGCLLNLCTTLGNYYFPFKEKLEKEQKNEGYGIKDEGTSYPVSPAKFDGDTIGEPIKEPQEENPDFTEEDLEKAADEINEAIIKDIVESHKEPVTATKTNNTKTKKTNTKKKNK